MSKDLYLYLIFVSEDQVYQRPLCLKETQLLRLRLKIKQHSKIPVEKFYQNLEKEKNLEHQKEMRLKDFYQ